MVSKGCSRPSGRKKKIRKSKQLCSGVMKFSSILSPRGRNLPKAEAVRKVPMGSEKHRDQGKCRVTRHFITPTLISPEKSLGLHQSKICNTFKYFFGGFFFFFFPFFKFLMKSSLCFSFFSLVTI